MHIHVHVIVCVYAIHAYASMHRYVNVFICVYVSICIYVYYIFNIYLYKLYIHVHVAFVGNMGLSEALGTASSHPFWCVVCFNQHWRERWKRLGILHSEIHSHFLLHPGFGPSSWDQHAKHLTLILELSMEDIRTSHFCTVTSRRFNGLGPTATHV